MHSAGAGQHLSVRVAGVLALVATIVVLGAPPSAAHPGGVARPAAPEAASAPSPGHESQFVSRINSLRASKGLPALATSDELVGVARAWTERMVQAGQISHNPQLASQVGGGWTKLGENVGVGYDVDSLMAAFIASPAHYDNLVDTAWTHVGVGVSVAADGRLYTTHNFMALPPAAPPPPPPPPPPAPSAGRSVPLSPSAATATTGASGTPVSTAAAAPPPEATQPTEARVTALLGPLRSLEQS